MERLSETKIVLIKRETRLDELKARYNTIDQARFHVSQSGANFEDYEAEDKSYKESLKSAKKILEKMGRVQEIHRSFLPNMIFGKEEIIVCVGQDGLVANTLKYLNGQALLAVNPDPKRYDGKLLPFCVKDLELLMPEVLRQKRPTKKVTMAKAILNNGQNLYAVNDIFIGPKSHGSAHYTISFSGNSERHSSSGVIISTGLGSSGWLKSMIAGARGIARAISGDKDLGLRIPQITWDARHLFFTVREPFPSKISSANIVFGKVSDKYRLVIESHMSERGVIFSDGMETDFIDFNSGIKAEIRPAKKQGILIV